jgi:hypothetical protein
MTAGLPWSLWACHRLIDAPSPARAGVLGALLVAQGLACAYYGIFAGLSVGLAVLFHAVSRGLWRVPRYWMLVAAAAAIAIGGILPFFLPYLRVEGADFNRSLTEAVDYSADWRSYLASSTWAHRWMLPLIGRWKEVAFPGFLTSGLAVLTLALAFTGRLRPTDTPRARAGAGRGLDAGAHTGETVSFYSLLAALAAWCSLGPDGRLYSLFFHSIPVFGFLRAPGRFAILVALALAVLAAIAVARLARGSPGRRLAVSAAITSIVAVELAAMPLPIPDVDPTPHRVYTTLARLPRAPVCELPFFWTRPDFPRHTRYMVGSTAHWLPLVNGYSDHFPEDFRRIVYDLSSFPTRASFAILRQRRVRYVVFHVNLYDRRSRERLLERIHAYGEFIAPILKHDDLWLYEITRWP